MKYDEKRGNNVQKSKEWHIKQKKRLMHEIMRGEKNMKMMKLNGFEGQIIKRDDS